VFHAIRHEFLFLFLFIETWILIPVTKNLLQCTIFYVVDFKSGLFHVAPSSGEICICQENSMRRATIAAIAALSLFLSACSTSGVSSGNKSESYCEEHRTQCIVGGVILVGAVTAIIVHNNRDDDSAVQQGPSDQRLKRDIKPLTVTGKGVKIYSFHYLGDDRLFSGVLAQDLLADPETAEAVSKDENGFYSVDYARLGLPVVNGDAMLEAGRKAEQIAMGQAYEQ
jgi:hypothetical protein